MMIDPRFEEDTLFMVFEEDFRFEDDEHEPQGRVKPTPLESKSSWDVWKSNVPRPYFVFF